MTGGWIPAYRRMFDPDHWLAPNGHAPASSLHAWLDLCQMATHTPRETTRAGTLERGELVVSIRTLAKRWSWEKRRVERFVSGLKRGTAIATVRETPDGMVYRVVKYEVYAVGVEGQVDSEGDTKGDTNGTQRGTRTITEAFKKKKTTSDDPAFDSAWSAYPKRSGSNPKQTALRAWRARMVEGSDPALILEGVQRYAAYVRAEGKEGTPYVLQASTFFGPDKRWLEPYVPHANGNGNGREPEKRRVIPENFQGY